MTRRVLLTGAGGQLAHELIRTAPADCEVVALSHADCDISRTDAEDLLAGYQPELIINAAAYTAVDRAEDERELAYAVNCEGAGRVALAAKQSGARLIQISSDFVFDGRSSLPYSVSATPSPVGVYAASKLAGELRVRQIAGSNASIVRSAWIYSSYGNNFVKTMLKLMREREVLSVVTDQIGTPTWARGLAQAIWEESARPTLCPLWHWTDLGVASWYDFSVAIKEEALALGILTCSVQINPVSTWDYPTRAVRPAYSVLDKSASLSRLSAPAVHWREALRCMLSELHCQEQSCA